MPTFLHVDGVEYELHTNEQIALTRDRLLTALREKKLEDVQVLLKDGTTAILTVNGAMVSTLSVVSKEERSGTLHSF